MTRLRIAIFAADLRRDLPGALLTAYELCQLGADCFVLPFRGGIPEIWALAPDFVLMPVFRPYIAESVRAFAAAGIQFGLLDTEGVVWSSLDEYRQTMWQDTELTRKARVVCVWGPVVARYAREAGLFFDHQLATTGSPRFDFYSAPLDSIYAAPDAKKSTILINTNFTIGNPDYGDPRIVTSRLIKNYGYDAQTVAEWLRHEMAAIPAMADLANQLAEDFPNLQVVLRPHPQERAETYSQLLSPRGNLSLSGSDSIYPWVLRSLAVIQRSCTTALEACMAGSLAISPRWIPASNFYPAPEAASYPAAEYSAVRNVLECLQAGRFALPEPLGQSIRTTLSESFHKADGLAHKRVATVIMDGIATNVRPNAGLCRRNLYKLRAPDRPAGSTLARYARYLLRLSPDLSFRGVRAQRDEANSGWSVDHIRSFVRRISEAKARENPAPVAVYGAKSEHYTTKAFSGRAVLLCRQPS